MTIYITRNEINRAVFTLNESTTLLQPKFILQIESKIDRKNKLMWLFDDFSLNTNRYNEFLIQEVPKIDEDLEDLKVFLPESSYNFYVWETESDNLDLVDATKIIESGKLIVIK